MASSYPSASSSPAVGRHFPVMPTSISISASASTSKCEGYDRPPPVLALSTRGSLKSARISHGLSHVSGSLSLASSFLRLQCINSVARRKNANHSRSRSLSVVRAAFLYDWMSKLCRFLVGTPIKLFAQKLEDELDRASKMVVDGAKMVKDAADQVDELAEKVESLAEKTSAIADQVDDVALDIHKQINDVLDVLEGEKDFTIIGSTFEIVDKKDPQHTMSITIEEHEATYKEKNDEIEVPPTSNGVS